MQELAAAEIELKDAREHLQALIEELATANEEAQAANEELQAANEELESANAKMQATNEELSSLNAEFSLKAAELQQLNEEYTYLYDSLEFPILVFDRQAHLRRFNVAAGRELHLRATALQQHVGRLKLPDALASLETRLSEALTRSETGTELVRLDDRLLQVAVTPGIATGRQVDLLVVSLLDVTEVTRAQLALKESRSRLDAVMNNTTVLLAMKDLAGRYQFVNPSFCEAFALKEEDILGRTPFEIFPEAFAADVWAHDLQALRERRPIIAEHLLSGEREYLIRTAHQLLCDAEGNPSAIITESTDITLLRRAERQLRLTATPAEAIGQNITRLLAVAPEDQAAHDRLWAAIEEKGFWQGEFWDCRKNGERFPIWLTINRIEELDERYYIGVFADISQLKETQRLTEHQATHDALTGLPNRALFQDRLRLAMAQARRSGRLVALLFLDLDHFKTINDTLGHDVGDQLLIQVGARLKGLVREMDTVARLGGDEFTIILSDATIEGAEQVAQRIVEALHEPVLVESRSLYISTSMGLAFFPEDGQSTAELIKAADTAMYRAKESGRDRYELFKAELQTQLLQQARLEAALRRALQDRQLRLVFQPKFALHDGALVGAEALLRWHDSELGEMVPGEFIPVAERCGLILEIDRRVARLAIEALARWRNQGLTVYPLAINVSAASFQDERFLDDLLGYLKIHSVNPTLLQVELTERTLLERSSTVLGNIERLRESDIPLSIDDFGTGYSSMAYLKRLPLVELKIDKSFIDGLAGADRNDEAIVKAILGMAAALELRTVAEGVETQAQHDWLRAHGCDQVQGYLLARPEQEADYRGRLQALHDATRTARIPQGTPHE